MIIVREKKLTEGKPVINSTFSNGHLKVSIDIDCMEALKSLNYDIPRYDLQGVTPQDIANALTWHISDLKYMATNDDHELAACVSSFLDK